MKTNLDLLKSRKELFTTQHPDEAVETFSVTTYNILSDIHMLNSANFDFFNYYYKAWSGKDYLAASEEEKVGRKEKAIDEMKVLNSDILCLQEVCVSFFNQLSTSLKKHGYQSYFFRKTFGTGEGIAICIKTKKFTVLRTNYMPWSDLLEAKRSAYGIDKETVTFCDIDTVSLALELQSVESGQILLLCNFHALYEPECPDVSVLQIAWITERLAAIQKKMKRDYQLTEDCPVIYVGDFNQDPSFYGYQIIVNGKLSPDEVHHLQHTMYSVENDRFNPVLRKSDHVAACFFPNDFVVPLKFYSAYKEAKGSESPTCVDRSLLVCLDYIFYSNGLQLLSILDLPDLAKLRASGEVTLLPSDHLPLRATFAFGRDRLLKDKKFASKL